MSVSSSIIALEHILKYGGSAYLARDDISAYLDAGKLHRVREPVFLRKSHLVYLRDSPLRGIIDTVISGLHQIA